MQKMKLFRHVSFWFISFRKKLRKVVWDTCLNFLLKKNATFFVAATTFPKRLVNLISAGFDIWSLEWQFYHHNNNNKSGKICLLGLPCPTSPFVNPWVNPFRQISPTHHPIQPICPFLPYSLISNNMLSAYKT